MEPKQDRPQGETVKYDDDGDNDDNDDDEDDDDNNDEYDVYSKKVFFYRIIKVEAPLE